MSNFEQFGGLVLNQDKDGRPVRWKCGLDAEGRKIDPPEIDDQPVIHQLAHDGSWEGVVADETTEAEKHLWQEL